MYLWISQEIFNHRNLPKKNSDYPFLIQKLPQKSNLPQFKKHCSKCLSLIPGHPKPITDHKTYPVHLLLTSNFKMPPDVDRSGLEKHLNDEDFQMIFQMSRDDFYALPLWRRNDFKRRVRLF